MSPAAWSRDVVKWEDWGLPGWRAGRQQVNSGHVSQLGFYLGDEDHDHKQLDKKKTKTGDELTSWEEGDHQWEDKRG